MVFSANAVGISSVGGGIISRFQSSVDIGRLQSDFDSSLYTDRVRPKEEFKSAFEVAKAEAAGDYSVISHSDFSAGPLAAPAVARYAMTKGKLPPEIRNMIMGILKDEAEKRQFAAIYRGFEEMRALVQETQNDVFQRLMPGFNSLDLMR